MHSRSYQFGNSRLTLEFGDITTSEAQVLVSSDDWYITMGGGVSASILRAGGEAIALDASKKVPAALGDIVVTTAGSLKAQYIFHAITIGPDSSKNEATEVVEKTTRRCMQLLEGLQLSSIAFPAIGSGAAGFSYSEVASTMARVIAEELKRRKDPVSATVCLFDRFGRMREMDFVQFFEEFALRAPRIAEHLVSQTSREEQTKATTNEMVVETQEEIKRVRLHSLRRILAELEEQRGKVEQQFIASLAGGDVEVQARIQLILKSNLDLRLQYLGELQCFADAKVALPPQAVPLKSRFGIVFVSSTYKDLVDARSAVKDALARCDLFFRGMEHFGAFANSQPAATVIVEEVRKADAYLGIFGVRYGSIDPVTGLSMTELEFREAEASRKPMLLYVVHAEAPITVSNIESDPVGFQKLASLKAHILNQYVAYHFKSVDDLARQVFSDLLRLKTEHS